MDLDFLSITIRVLLSLIGFILFYAGAFLYEDEQGKIQNILEDTWIKINSQQKTKISQHVAFFQEVAKLIDNFLIKAAFARDDSKKLAVEKVIEINKYSLTFSAGFMLIVLFYTREYLLTIAPFFFHFAIFLILAVYLAYCLHLLTRTLLFINVFTFVIDETNRKLVWYLVQVPVSLFILFSPYIMLTNGLKDEGFTIVMLLQLWLSFYLGGVIANVLNSFFIIFIRTNLLSLSKLEPTFGSIISALTDTLMLWGVLTGPCSLFLLLLLQDFYGSIVLSGSLFYVAAFSLPQIVFAIFAMFLTGSMLAHRAFWPVLDRPIYTLQRIGITQRNKFLVRLGGVLMGFGILGFQWIENIPSWFKELTSLSDKLVG